MVVFYKKQRDAPLGLISAFYVHCLLCKGCIAIWLMCMTQKTYKVRIKDILMVQNFPNVFLDKFLYLPLEREMKFAINLVLKTHLIFLPPYRMAQVELKELKT